MTPREIDFEFQMLVTPVKAELAGWESVRRHLADMIPGTRAATALRRDYPHHHRQISQAMLVLRAPGRTLSDKVEIIRTRLDAGLPALTVHEYRDYLALTRPPEAR